MTKSLNSPLVVQSKHDRRRRVDVNHPTYQACVDLAKEGFSDRAINAVTGLTQGRISYRLKMEGVRRRAWRNGQTPEAVKAIKALVECQELKARIDRAIFVAKAVNRLSRRFRPLRLVAA